LVWDFLKAPQTNALIKHNNQMKNPTRSLALGIALFGAASAAMAVPSTQNQDTIWSLTSTFQNFTFTKFDASLGTLTAVDLIFNSATVGGSVNITNNTGGAINIDALRSRIRVSGTGLSSTDSTQTAIPSTPSTPFVLAGGTPQNFNLTSTSLLGMPWTLGINAGSISSYVGSGNTDNFVSRLQNTASNDGDPGDITSLFSFTAPSTSVTLRYTYTPSGPVPIPEPGQVAASLLLLGGIGAYYFVKRRRKSAPAAA
jgi:hypothetical protein